MNFVRGILAQQDEHKMHRIEDPQGLFQFSKSLSKSSRRIALEAAKSLALDCKNEIKPRELVKYIDNVLDILDFPLAEDY